MSTEIAMAGANVLGTVMSAGGAASAGYGAEQAARFQAAQLRQNAGQQEAAAQRTAAEDIRQGELMISRAMAVAGASGAGVTDPTVLNIIGNISKEGKLASLTSLYEGESAAAGMRRQAAAAEFEGGQVRKAGEIKAMSTLLSGAKGFGDLYSGG